MNDETVRVLSWNGFSELLQGPFRRRMSRHIAVYNPACPDFDEHKHIEDAKGRRYDNEEIACHDRPRMVTHEGQPSLGGIGRAPRRRSTGQVFPDRSRGDSKAQL